MGNFEARLQGGHPNSLGNTLEIVEEVLTQNHYFPELFNCYFSDDAIVRLRTSNAMKRICRAQKSILVPYINQLLTEIAAIDQASVQWTLSQLFGMLKAEMSPEQIEAAKKIMKKNLENHHDWIVLNQTIDTLSQWAKKDLQLKEWLQPHLERLSADSRKSIAGRAKKMMAALKK
ncbi:MAG: hypothetical protein OHK0053_14220 [Microscillaceae bacterium]